MKYLIILIGLLLSLSVTQSQSIENVMASVNLDSLSQSVRILSGEDSIQEGDHWVTIQERASLPGRSLAAQYITRRLKSYDLSVMNQSYGETGTNIIATQAGSYHPDSIFIISAHYDSVTSFAADDNASGVATVLEAARILSSFDLNYTLIYALWDEEELGLWGSRYFAEEASKDQKKIIGVLNLDMLGYDSNDDFIFDIHTNNNQHSLRLKDELLNTLGIYKVPLNPMIYNPGTSQSDHQSFWDYNFGAVLLIEGYYSGDFNPYYHTVNDRINLFNLSYYKEISKLAIGTIAAMAELSNPASIPPLPDSKLMLYPNPAKGYFHIKSDDQSILLIQIHNIEGELMQSIDNIDRKSIPIHHLPGGVYFITIFTDNGFTVKKLIKL